MLNMGFHDDVEAILNAGGVAGAEGAAFQTLLFSATMPEWVSRATPFSYPLNPPPIHPFRPLQPLSISVFGLCSFLTRTPAEPWTSLPLRRCGLARTQVKEISERFLRPSRKTVDLVGSSKLKASASVRHLWCAFRSVCLTSPSPLFSLTVHAQGSGPCLPLPLPSTPYSYTVSSLFFASLPWLALSL